MSMASPEDLMLQLFSLQRRRTSSEDNEQQSMIRHELLELMYDANSDGSSEADDYSSSEDVFG